MSLPVRLWQALVNAAWRATHRPPRQKALGNLQSVTPGSGGWINLVREPFTGAWQRNLEASTDTVLTYSAVFRCIGLISSDIAKLRMRLVRKDANGIWREEDNPAFSPVLRKPNRYQTRIQFFASWVESKLVHGNTYVLKGRDARNVVTSMYVLNPELVTVLCAPDGTIFYELRADNVSGIQQTVRAPASEIIHDRWYTIYHPLVGTSPIHANGIAALQGLRISETSTKFFTNNARPGGILTAPGHIPKETAQRVKDDWDQIYGSAGGGFGQTAVLGDGLKYESMQMTATDAQLLEQLKWSAETVASTFGVPSYMINIGQPPTVGSNVEALQIQYYSQCLQKHIEDIEELLDDGLGLGPRFGNQYGSEFDPEDLLRMDTASKVRAAAEAVKAGFMAPNEARAKFDLGPVQGGDSPYLQQQNYSLAALDRRDSAEPPPEPTIDEEIGPDDDDGGGEPDEPEDEESAEEERAIIYDLAREKLRRFTQREYRRHSA
jgi:HK97 family phage portal protein